MNYDYIEFLLEEKRISKRKLAKMANIPYNTLMSAFHRRSTSFSIEYLGQIADVLGVTVDSLRVHKPVVFKTSEGKEIHTMMPVPVGEQTKKHDKNKHAIAENYNNSSETGKELILDVSTAIRKAHPLDTPTTDD